MEGSLEAWVVRAGRGGVNAGDFERHGLVGVALEQVPSIAGWSREQVVERAVALLDEPSPKAYGYAAMLYRFAHEMQVGDLVLVPDTEQSEVLVGRVIGDYEFLDPTPIAGQHHVRRVQWLARIARSNLPEQVRHATGAPMAVFKPGAQEAVVSSVREVVQLD